jgi:two-component system response regulator AtoC
MAELLAHDWPGNVRELQNTLSRAAVLCRSSVVRPGDISFAGGGVAAPEPMPDDRRLAAVERRHVQRVLADTGGNKSEAARILGISRPRLHRMTERWDLPLN